MKFIFWPVSALSLATFVLLATPALCASTDVPSEKGPQSGEPSNPGDLFPLNKHNGIQVHMETVTEGGDKKTEHQTLNPTFVAGDKALKKVIADPENANAVELTVAAAGTLRAGDLEEAGFLIFAAQLREYQDLECYPPKKDEPESTETMLGTLIGFVRSDVVLRELQFQPKVLVGVIKRLETLQLKEPADYKPGWDYATHVAKPDLFAKNKAAMLDELKPTSELLLVPDYFAAFERFSESNQLPPEAQVLPANAQRRAQAIKTMKRIEKEKNLHGVMFQMEQAEAN